jgi:hypothetical protein
MRSILFVPMALALVACGDDGGSPAVDAAPIDMAPMDMAAACGYPASIPAGSVGTMQMRGAGDWVRTMNNVTTFGIRVDLEMPVGGVANAMLLTYQKPAAGGFVLNTALPFETNPMGTGEVGLILFEKLNASAGTALKTYFPASGSITFTALAETMGMPTTATVAMTNLREINASTGADVPSGCTTMLAGLSLYLTESTTVAHTPDSGFEFQAATLSR